MMTLDREYEKHWQADFSLSSTASAIARLRIDAGQNAPDVISAIASNIRPSFRVENRSFWSDVLREFVDFATLEDWVAVSGLELAALRRRRRR
jgi:hypothetical protein